MTNAEKFKEVYGFDAYFLWRLPKGPLKLWWDSEYSEENSELLQYSVSEESTADAMEEMLKSTFKEWETLLP